MSRRKDRRRPSLGDSETGKMTPEQLEAHRELQFLRAAGTLGSARRVHRRPKHGDGKSREELADWVGERAVKLAEL